MAHGYDVACQGAVVQNRRCDSDVGQVRSSVVWVIEDVQVPLARLTFGVVSREPLTNLHKNSKVHRK